MDSSNIKCSLDWFMSAYVETQDVPCYALNLNIKGLKGCYKKDDFFKAYEELISRREKWDIYNTFASNWFDTFKIRLDTEKDNLISFNSTKYTKERWFSFVDSKLDDQRQSKIVLNTHVNQCVKLATIINKILEDYKIEEIYSLNAVQISEILNSSTRTDFLVLKVFFSIVEEDIKLQMKEFNTRINKGFNLSKVKNYKKNDEDKEEDKESEEYVIKDIYEFEAWSAAFNFITDYKYHSKIAVDRVLKDGNIVYPSVWLFLLLFLNNAWRRSDVAKFPRLYIQDLISEFKIDSIDWFKENELTLTQARTIITRVISKEFIMSKNQWKGHFC